MRETNEIETELYNRALRLLTRRDHSRTELSQKLKSRLQGASEIDNETLERVFNRLEDHGYLNDQRFAESYTRARMTKGFGADRIAMELAEKGISSAMSEMVLADYEEDWPALIQRVWQKKYRQPPEDFAERARQQNFLRYRGFRTVDIDRLFRSLRAGSAVEDS